MIYLISQFFEGSLGRALDKRKYLIMIFFLILVKTIHFDPSSELSCQDGSDEGSQHTFLCRINKNYPLLSPNTPSYLELCLCLIFVLAAVESFKYLKCKKYY